MQSLETILSHQKILYGTSLNSTGHCGHLLLLISYFLGELLVLNCQITTTVVLRTGTISAKKKQILQLGLNTNLQQNNKIHSQWRRQGLKCGYAE